jgi:hypothetical protein
LETAGAAAEDMKQEVGEVGTDASYARQKAEGAKSKEEAALKEQEAWNRQIQDLEDQIKLLLGESREAWSMAKFFQEHFARQIYSDVVQAALEAWADQRINFLKLLNVIYESGASLRAAGTGTGARPRVDFTPSNNLRVKEPTKAQFPEYTARAEAQDRKNADQIANLNRKKADSYPAKKLAEAKNEHKKNNADFAKQQEKEKVARQRYTVHRDVNLKELREKLRETYSKSRELEKKSIGK